MPKSPVSRPSLTWSSVAALVLFSAALAFFVFVLPWHIPGRTFNKSFSWVYGFNNLAAVLGVGVMLAAALGWLLFFQPPGGFFATVRDGVLQVLPTEPYAGGNKRLRKVFLGVWAVAVTLILGWFTFLPYAYFGESAYFLTRLDWMVMGKVPYRDFVMNYGPLQVYLTYWIYQLGAGALSTEQAYGASLALNWLFGLYLIYYVVTRLKGDFSRTTIFCIMAAGILNLSLGFNYTPLRFMIAFACVLGMHDTVLSVANQRWAPLKIGVAAFLAPLAGFAVSPEMGMAAWLGCLAWFVILLRTSLRRFCWGFIAVATALPATALFFSPNYFDSLLSFGGGGYNFPIYPTIFILFFFFMLFCVSPALASSGLTLREPSGPLAAALCMATGVPVMAALGRCDPGHVSFNGMGISILFLAALSRARSRWFRPVAGFYVLVFVIGMLITTWGQYDGLFYKALKLRRALTATSGGTQGLPAQAKVSFNGLRYSKMLPLPPSYNRLLAFPGFGIPIGCDEGLERFLKLSDKLVFEYHMEPGGDAVQETDLQRKFADMKRMKFIIVAKKILDRTEDVDLEILSKADSKFLSKLMLFPIKLKPVNAFFDSTKRTVQEIKEHYTEVGTVGWDFQTYVVLQRNESVRK